MDVHERMNQLGITLPSVAVPAAAYVPFVRSGRFVFLSGHLAKREGKPWIGKLGKTMETVEGKCAARAVAIDLLGTLHAAAGDLSMIERIVKLTILVNSSEDFTEHHLVANGASEVLCEVLEDKGIHARSAFGVSQIPLGACVEIELVAELRAS
jgi:enamine deaminase RidA (YjgF/YER057c/UK114 family)